MNNPLMQIRQFHDGTWSVTARVWNANKAFYEHPDLINLTKEEAQMHCNRFIENPPTIDEVVEKWLHIGS